MSELQKKHWKLVKHIRVITIKPKTFREKFSLLSKMDKEIFRFKSFQYDKDFFIKHVNRKSLQMLVYADGKIVGYLHAFPENDYFYLCSIALLDKYRGYGIGTKLMRSYINKGTCRGYTKFRLHSINKVMIELAERFGFKVIRKYPDYVGRSTAVLMELDID